MKIGHLQDNFPEGKVKFDDYRLKSLAEKFSAKKVTPFFASFIKDDFAKVDAVVVSQDKILDLFIIDMDKIDLRLNDDGETEQKQLLQKCLKSLEENTPLCDLDFSQEQLKILKNFNLITLKPTVIIKEDDQLKTNKLIELVLQKSNAIFFYTAGPKEVKAWLVKASSNIVSCAGKIHSDLARGFIKGEVVNYQQFMELHNMQEAKSKGILQVVGRDYIVKDGDILTIRFNV
jgi:ribosome-binding ATPase YchF (GTP1/OBG family)